MWKKIWKDPVGSKVVARLITGFIFVIVGLVTSYFIGWFPLIKSWIYNGLDFLVNRTSTGSVASVQQEKTNLSFCSPKSSY